MFQIAYNVLNHNQKGVTMKTLTINAENWTGEDENIKLYADGRRFNIGDGDETFRIVPKKYDMSEFDEPDFHEYKVQYKYNSDDEWKDTDIKGAEHHRQTVGDRQLCPRIITNSKVISANTAAQAQKTRDLRPRNIF